MRERLVPLLETCFNYMLEDGSPPSSWREAFISVIPKEGKDWMDCKGYRLISVLMQTGHFIALNIYVRFMG